MSKVVKEINGITYEFISDINTLYSMKEDSRLNRDEDNVFFCYKNNKIIKRLSILDGGFSCSRKEFEGFDVIEFYNIETTVVFVKDGNFNKYIEEHKEELKEEEVKEVKKSSIFKRMWEIIRDTQKKLACKISEVSKSIALKMAYEEQSKYEIEQKKPAVQLKDYPITMKKVCVGKSKMFSNGEKNVEFCSFYGAVRVFDVLYIEKSRDVYEYFWIDENYELVPLTKSHFGFKNTCIWETMCLNHDKETNFTDAWIDFFQKMEDLYNY